MKKFRMSHLFFDNVSSTFTESDPPGWLASKVYKWWWEKYILKLNNGESIKSDFQKIKSIS